MSPSERTTLLGVGVGIAAAGVATVAGVALDRLRRDREQAVSLGTDDDFTITPQESHVVVADDGVPLHVEVDVPDGLDQTRPTVVLCHGYTLDLRCWVYQRRALHEAGYRVVAWDQRGHGSSGVGDAESYQVEQLGADLRQVIDQVAPEGDLVLVGHSMGGMSVMALAEDDPGLIRQRVVGVALISTSARGLHRVTWGLGSVLGGVVNRVGPLAMTRLAGRQDIIDAAMRGGRKLQELIVDRSAFASPVPLSVVRLTADMIFGTTMEVMAAFVPGLNRHDKAEALAHLQGVELLVLNGDKDLLTSPVHSEEIIDHAPHAEHVLVTAGGHIIMLEHPDTVSGELLALILRAERAGRQQAAPGRPRPRHTVTDLHRQRSGRQARRSRKLRAQRRERS
ncbi:MAG: alpha/beta hydrolase [Actinomycetota bacterium]|nr:alpha/beta hydrolase [Actinomycetota bacterium]